MMGRGRLDTSRSEAVWLVVIVVGSRLADPLMASESTPETSKKTRDGDTGKRVLRIRDAHDWVWRLSLCVLAAAVGYGGLRALRSGTSDPEAIWKEAEANVEAGKFDAVDSAVAQLIRLRKPNASDWYLRGQLAVARHEADAAIAFLSRVPDDHGLAAQARLLAGQTELRRSRVRYAEEWLVAATRLDPRLVQAHRELIYIYATLLRRAELECRVHRSVDADGPLVRQCLSLGSVAR